MFYHVHIESVDAHSKGGCKHHFEYDFPSTDIIINKILKPYLMGESIQFDGYFLAKEQVNRIKIIETAKTAEQEKDSYSNNRRPNSSFLSSVTKSGLIFGGTSMKDVSRELLEKARSESLSSQIEHRGDTKQPTDKTKVFIVHGQDDLARLEVSSFLSKLGLEPIVLHEQASSGSTIIEKIEKYTDVGFGVVLYTPCDTGAKQSVEPEYRPRARQNVVFEHGYLIGKLSRKNVCALVKGDVETPNDISGVVYVLQDIAGAWKLMLAKELKSSGYNIDMNKVL
ncbi:DNA-binding protein [Yersinia similis]|uniref:DNA-binding protein n=1 Tax=Yersinia similis TaxID=367190 RepID=A0ABM5Q2K3_9GAMM|nr:nucleotide-binding protein [Yersinia similis]AHK20994.1 DNA-binding protein [Yersinia similis]CFQ49171.1 Predicted nucleotide-binding protein containing TIR-like domain [Yersinia similis]